MRAIRIGVTGKLGSGKSTLLEHMEARGIPGVRSDDLARDLMERDANIRSELIRMLGPEAYSNGSLDRPFIASKIFADRELLREVEHVVHPAVTREILKRFDREEAAAIAIESALILQTEFRECFDYIILVETDNEAAIARATASDRITEADAEARLREQDYDRVAREEADFIIENNGDKASFERKCETLIDILEPLYSREMPGHALHAMAAEEV